MENFYAQMLKELSQNRGLVVITITATKGSVPRSQGTKMLVTDQGKALGTIGGGDLEFTATRLAKDLHLEKKSFTQSFPIHQSEDHHSTLEDKGSVVLNFQYLESQDPSFFPALVELDKAFKKRTPCLLVTEITPQGTRLFINTPSSSTVPLEITKELETLDFHFPLILEKHPSLFIIESPVDPQRVLVYGCGHVGVELINLLSHVGFYLIAVDQRPTQLEPTLIPGAKERHLVSFSDAVSVVTPTEYDSVLITTPNHDWDYQVLSKVLATPAAFVGMLGSHRKVAATMERLQRDAFTQEDKNRITSPIGLDIGAQTPQEIAVSVAAQFIQQRAEKRSTT